GITAIFVVTRLGLEKRALRFRSRRFVGGIAGLTQENRSEDQRLSPAKTARWRPRISCCHHSGFIPILGAVRMEWKSFWLALLVISGALLAGGCGGINASKSISPASFFLPGFGDAKPVPPPESVPSSAHS